MSGGLIFTHCLKCVIIKVSPFDVFADLSHFPIFLLNEMINPILYGVLFYAFYRIKAYGLLCNAKRKPIILSDNGRFLFASVFLTAFLFFALLLSAKNFTLGKPSVMLREFFVFVPKLHGINKKIQFANVQRRGF